jgi:uncharacterized iron-regulated membrane protein
MLRWSLQLHKWIALIVGIQVLFWVLGGVVMTAIPIERVRSEHHVAEHTAPPLAIEGLMSAQGAAEAARVTPVEALLKTTPRGPVWAFRDVDGKTTVVDAARAKPLARLSPEEAKRFAVLAYAGEGRPVSTRYLPVAPQETGKEGPLWRVDFDDAEKTSFYLSPETGEVVSRRSDVWRFYDFFWRLHIMDLETGEDFNHPLIIGASLLTLAVVLTGFILLWIRLSRDLRPRAR